ncbi:MAG: hypothetical protein RJA22_2742 [Verrucomicrobiota bacterium]|jgi:hypothetical protein
MKALPLLVAVLLSWSIPFLPAQNNAPADPGANRPRRLANPALPRMGPWNNDLELSRSRDGKPFSQPTTFVERAGVPCLAQDAQGRLIAVFQWFPMDRREDFDRIAIAFSTDKGATWTEPRRVTFTGLPEDYVRQFDPTIVVLPDGRFRLYFTSHPGFNPGQENTAIYSAISKDALAFAFEPGVRFAAAEENVVDCAVARLGDTWHLYAPLPRQEGRAFHGTSRDGLQFERQPDVSLPDSGTWIGNVIAVEGGLRFYGSGRDGLWSARSKEGISWQLEEGLGLRGGDPAVWRLPDGELLAVFVGGPRADAPMDPPWLRRPQARADQPALPAGEEPRLRTTEPTTPAAPGITEHPTMTVANNFLYVLRDGVIYQYQANTLEFVRQTTLPAPEGRRLQRPSLPRPPLDGQEPGQRPRLRPQP